MMAIEFKMRPVAVGLEYALGRRDDTFAAGIQFDSHAQCAAKCLEDGLALMVCVFALQVVDVQGGLRMVGKTLEKFTGQVDVEMADVRSREGNVVKQPGTTGEVDNHARKGFIQRHIGVTV